MTAIRGALFAAAAVFLAACTGDGFPTVFVGADDGVGAQVAFIELTPDTVRIQRVGGSVEMSAVPIDAQGDIVSDAAIRWSSTDLAVATVSAEGVVIGRGQGRAQIVAAAGGVEERAIVSVALDAPGTGTP